MANVFVLKLVDGEYMIEAVPLDLNETRVFETSGEVIDVVFPLQHSCCSAVYPSLPWRRARKRLLLALIPPCAAHQQHPAIRPRGSRCQWSGTPNHLTN